MFFHRFYFLKLEWLQHFNRLLSRVSQPFPKGQILDSSKLKESADDNFKFGENGRKFSIQVENTVGKGEIARYE